MLLRSSHLQSGVLWHRNEAGIPPAQFVLSCNSNLVDISSSKAAQDDMVRLYPACPHALPALPENSPFFAVVGDERFVKIWNKHIANRAAAGPSKFSGDHGTPLLQDKDCLRGLAVISDLQWYPPCKLQALNLCMQPDWHP